MPISTIDNTGVSPTAGISTSKLGAGALVQVVYASTTTAFTTSSSTYVATPLTATITKQLTNSKILIMASPMLQAYINGGAEARAGGMIYDVTNSRQIIDFNCVNRNYVSGTTIHVEACILNLQAYDTNSGTGSRQYTFYTKLISGTASNLNIDSNGEATSTIVLMEIAG